MKMINPRMLAIVLVPGLLLSQAALAVSVNITSNLTASPCTVETTSPVSVALPDIDMAKLAAVDSTSTAQSFDLTLKNCPTTTTKVIATYKGKASTLAADSFDNTGTATQLALRLKDNTDVTIEPNASRTVKIDTATNKATFTQSVQMYSKGKVQAGTVIGNIVVDFTYQ